MFFCDGILAVLFLQCKSCLLTVLHKVLVKCWREGKVPQDIPEAMIITLNKNKGARSDCNNHRGISLLDIAGKDFARGIVPRLTEVSRKSRNGDLDFNAPPLT